MTLAINKGSTPIVMTHILVPPLEAAPPCLEQVRAWSDLLVIHSHESLLKQPVFSAHIYIVNYCIRQEGAAKVERELTPPPAWQGAS